MKVDHVEGLQHVLWIIKIVLDRTVAIKEEKKNNVNSKS